MGTRFIIGVSLLSVAGACVTTVQSGGIDGVYTGQGALQMTITSPAYRELPPETTNSFVAIRALGGGRALVNVRFNERGNQCTLYASTMGDGFVLDPGQYCRGLMSYGRFDVDATLQVTEGRGSVSGSLLSLQMQGQIDAQHRDGSHNLGVGRWSMQASR